VPFSREEILDLLRRSGEEFVALVQGHRPDQFHFKPGPDRWSIAETAEHITLAETGSGRVIRGKLTAAPAPAELLAQSADGEERIMARLGLEGRSFPAPEIVVPRGRWATPEEVLSVFQEQRAATIDFLATTPLDLSQYAFPHIALGILNGWQWGLFLGYHAQRHNRQLREIRASAGFPR
jgi:hypothetical protein